MSQTFLEVRNLVKIFGKLTAVNEVSFKVEQGEVVTLLRPKRLRVVARGLAALGGKERWRIET